MKKAILRFGFIILNMMSYGQSVNYVPQIAPSSPETAKFNQFIETPVGYNTGIPNIDIEIGEVTMDGVRIPISISYHADGIKVDEKATWVGLGWSLNAGCKVSRKENGLPDEKRFFWQNNVNSLSSIQGIKTFVDNNFMTPENVITLEYNLQINSNNDFRPDDFYYSTVYTSGKFLFSQQNQDFITFPTTMNKIDMNYETNKINNITITDDKGIKYYYGMNANDKERIRPLTHGFYSAWNISKIENVKKNNITFSYDKYNVQNYEKPIITKTTGFNIVTSNDERIDSELSYISEIVFPEGKIEFIATTDREDLKQFPKLHSILFKNNNNEIIKTVIFNYSYFVNNVGNISTDNYTENSGKRLKLMSVDFYNNLNTEKQTYTFSYYENNIPDRLNGGSDYWGYYNGTVGNTIPSYPWYAPDPNIPSFESSVMNGYFSNSNKNINSQTFNVFLLKEITYPTGAKQKYIYENNFGKLNNNNTQQLYFCLANKYLPVNQNLVNYNLSVSGLFGQNYSNGIYFGYPQPSEVVTLNQYEKKYIFRTIIPVSNQNIKSIGMLYTNNLSHNFNKNSQGVTNANQLNMNVEEKRYLVKNGIKTLIYSNNSLSTSLFNNQKPIFFYGSNLLNDNYDNLEIELSFTYNSLLVSQLNNKPFYFNYNLEDTKRDSNQIHNNNVYLVGGARIKEIQIEDNNSVVKQKKYKYSDDFSESGLAYFVPTFVESRAKCESYNDPFCGISCGISSSIYWSVSSSGIYNTSNGSNVAYRDIEEQIYGVNNSYLGKINYEYYLSSLNSDDNYISFNANPYSFINTYDWVNKSIKSKKVYKSNDNLTPILQEDYEYYFKKSDTPNNIDEIRTDLIHFSCRELGEDFLNSIFYTHNGTLGNSHPIFLPYFRHFEGFSLPKRKIVKEYLNGNQIISTTDYDYNFEGKLAQLVKKSTSSSSNQNLEERYYYPNDLSLEPNSTSMVLNNMLGEPIKSEKYIDGILLSNQKTQYEVFPSQIAAESMILPRYIYEGKGSDFEKKFTIDSYDSLGNITQYTFENGMIVSFIWGYNKTQLVAKLENIAYSSIPASLITAIQNATNSTTATEAQVIAELNALRASTDVNLQKAMITTFTYKPLIGVSTITDPKGQITTYEYDSFGRLQRAKDHLGNILSENEYHYRTQN